MWWEEFIVNSGGLGELCRERLVEPGVLLVATVRRDGTPRLSPVEPLILDGQLWLSMMWNSKKAADLDRDDRILLHNIITGPQDPGGEVKVRGRAVPEYDLEARRRYREGVAVLGWQPEEPHFHLFRIDIKDVVFIRYHANGDQQMARWPEQTEVIRRATSPTSVGDPEPYSDLFA